MFLSRKLQLAVVVLMGIVGVVIIYASGRIQIDPYSLILTIIVGVFIIYLYFLYVRNNE